MDAYGDIDDDSVALVVTSPPYFAGKEYEEAVGCGHVPADYIAYLEMLEAVFAECVRKLEPGGRIAVNVANLGRRPYRSLSADVVQILQDRLRLLLRGEVIWLKARGAAGSCAWGSFQQPANPVLRDLTERVVIASKGRLDRARPAAVRADEGLPSVSTAHVDEFMEATTDVWEIPPASATRVGHPAPFPVELPQRLIELYTYRATWCWTRSWGLEPPLWPPCAQNVTMSASIRTLATLIWLSSASPQSDRNLSSARTRFAGRSRLLAQRVAMVN